MFKYLIRRNLQWRVLSRYGFYEGRFKNSQLDRQQKKKRLQTLQNELIYLKFAENESNNRLSLISKLKILLRMQEKNSTLFFDQQITHLRNQLSNKMKQVDECWEEPKQQIERVRVESVCNFLRQIVEMDKYLLEIGKIENEPEYLREGYKLTHQMLLKILNSNNALEFQAQLNDKFNAEEHQTQDNVSQDSVVGQVIEKGWKYDNTILRKCKVKLK